MKRNIFIRNVDSAIWDKFRTIIAQKEQRLHGIIGDAVTNALKLYIDYLEKNQQHNINGERNLQGNLDKPKTDNSILKTVEKNIISSRTMKTLQKISNKVKQQYQYEVSQYDIEKIIRENAGGDPKTIHKYITLLQEYNHITPSRPIMETNKFIFRVNGLETNKT